MKRDNIVELEANWNSLVLAGIPEEDLKKMRLWCFGGGGLLIVLGLLDSMDPFLIFGGGLVLFLGIFVEIMKDKQQFQGTAIDFPPDYKEDLYDTCEDFLIKEGHDYEPMVEDLKLIKGYGFELRPSKIRLIVFDLTTSQSRACMRLGLRNISRDYLQEAIRLQIELDNFFLENDFIGIKPNKAKPPQYLWNESEYVPLREGKPLMARDVSPKSSSRHPSERRARAGQRQKTQPRRKTSHCQSCGQALSYIEEYQRWYCYDCAEYEQ